MKHNLIIKSRQRVRDFMTRRHGMRDGRILHSQGSSRTSTLQKWIQNGRAYKPSSWLATTCSSRSTHKLHSTLDAFSSSCARYSLGQHRVSRIDEKQPAGIEIDRMLWAAVRSCSRKTARHDCIDGPSCHPTEATASI